MKVWKPIVKKRDISFNLDTRSFEIYLGKETVNGEESAFYTVIPLKYIEEKTIPIYDFGYKWVYTDKEHLETYKKETLIEIIEAMTTDLEFAKKRETMWMNQSIKEMKELAGNTNK